MIIIENINKSYGERRVLRDVSFAVKSGETFSVIGQVGTGKSLLLRLIMGLEKPDFGDVIIDGVSVVNADFIQLDRLRLMMGVVFQTGALFKRMTIRENIALPLIENRIFRKKKAFSVADEFIEMYKLTDSFNKTPDQTDIGVVKRAAIARAAITKPQIILYDEPTTGLDPVMTSMVDDLIVETQERFKVTSIIITHNMRSAYTISDYIGVLYDTEFVQIGTPDEVMFSENEIVRNFVEGRKDNFVRDFE